MKKFSTLCKAILIQMRTMNNNNNKISTNKNTNKKINKVGKKIRKLKKVWNMK